MASRLRLQPLRLSIGWKVVWNSFYELDPPTDRKSGDWLYFSEDLLLLANTSARVLLDVSWRPYGRKGRFVLSVVNWLGVGEMPEQWERPMMQVRTRSRKRVVRQLDAWLDPDRDWAALKRRARDAQAEPLRVTYVRSQKLYEATVD